jgi:hypothetical protein
MKKNNQKKNKKLVAIGILSLWGLVLPCFALAEWCLETGLGVPGLNRGACVNIKSYVDGVYKLAGMAVGIVGVLMFLVGGFQYMIAAGNRASSGEARKTMINAIIGIVLVLAAYVLLSTINVELVDTKNLEFK